jgi:hypothetical protein
VLSCNHSKVIKIRLDLNLASLDHSSTIRADNMAQPDHEVPNRGPTDVAQQLSPSPNVPAINLGDQILEQIQKLQEQQQRQYQEQQQIVETGFQRLETRLDAT